MEIPTKYYYKFDSNTLVDSNGSSIVSYDKTPQAVFRSKPLINIQLQDEDGNDYTGLEAATTAQLLVDSDQKNAAYIVPMGATGWSSTTGSEYAISLEMMPLKVYFDAIEKTQGTAGSLSAGQWDYDATEGKLTVRLDDSSDPGDADDEWVTAKVSAASDITSPFIECFSDDINQAGTWYVSGAGFTDPDITSGQLSFRLNANTKNFLYRIGTSNFILATAEIQMYSGSGVLIAVKRMPFVCYNSISPSDSYLLDVTPLPWYSKTEVDALLAATNEFTELTDTPSSYSGQGGKFAKVNSGETAIEFDDVSSVVVANESSDTVCYPLFATDGTGSVGPKTNAGLLFNSATATLSATNIAGANTNWDAAYSHISSNGSDHSYIDQDVTNGASPTFGTLTATSLVKSGGTSLQFLKADGSVDSSAYLTAEVDTLATVMGRGATTGVQLTSTLATGTSPFAVASTTVNTNLNADKVDGFDLDQSVSTTGTPAFAGLTVNGGAQIGNASTNAHGINTAPVARNMITAEFSDTGSSGSSYMHKSTMTSTGSVEGEELLIGGQYVAVVISGTITDPEDYEAQLDATAGAYYATSTSTINNDGGYATQALTGLRGTAYFNGTLTSGDLKMHGVYGYAWGNADTNGSATKYGVYGLAQGTGARNIGGWFSATGGTNTYSIWADNGDITLHGDYMKMLFGSGEDASIQFDGDDLIINSENVTADDEVHFTNFSAYTFDADVIIAADNSKLTLGADGAADSYLQWNASGLDVYSSGGIVNIAAAADTDITLNFLGTTSSGVLKWMEDEDRFEFSDDVKIDAALTVTGAEINTPDSITATSEGVAASLATRNTEVTTNGDADLDNVTLADGTVGQTKHIYCKALGNASDTWKITPATLVGGSQITFTGAGQGCILNYTSAGWVIVGNNGGTIS